MRRACSRAASGPRHSIRSRRCRSQKVVIESKTSDVLGAAALLYLVPFVLLFLGYAIGSALGWGEGGCVLIGFAFFALGVACNVVYQRRKKASPITFEIIQVLET
ncbi:MAG: SoxR reducing system RseC family protein [Oscillospiraceae bacterium]